MARAWADTQSERSNEAAAQHRRTQGPVAGAHSAAKLQTDTTSGRSARISCLHGQRMSCDKCGRTSGRLAIHSGDERGYSESRPASRDYAWKSSSRQPYPRLSLCRRGHYLGMRARCSLEVPVSNHLIAAVAVSLLQVSSGGVRRLSDPWTQNVGARCRYTGGVTGNRLWECITTLCVCVQVPYYSHHSFLLLLSNIVDADGSAKPNTASRNVACSATPRSRSPALRPRLPPAISHLFAHQTTQQSSDPSATQLTSSRS